MTEDELKPCPFCGSEEAPEVYQDWDFSDEPWHEVHGVVCMPQSGGCGATGPFVNSRNKAIKLWNCRKV